MNNKVTLPVLARTGNYMEPLKFISGQCPSTFRTQRTSTVAMKITRVPSSSPIGKHIADGDNGAQKAWRLRCLKSRECTSTHQRRCLHTFFGDQYGHCAMIEQVRDEPIRALWRPES